VRQALIDDMEVKAQGAITPRHLHWNFDAEIPRDWFCGSPALTAMLDALTLVIPDNELYYIRIINRCEPRIGDASLKQQIRAFIAQEALHGAAHRAYWANMARHTPGSHKVVGVVNWLLYRVFEPLIPARLHMGNVAAIEHFNAYLGHIFLTRGLLARATPCMRRLFEWHFAEEIEHKAVAFDALKSAYPGYATRALSGVFVFAMVCMLLSAVTAVLLSTRKSLASWRTVRDLYGFWISQGVLRDSLSFTARYFRPGFHPWQTADYDLARPVLTRLE
jgi:predicted metal-dependent hydrolase